MTSPLPQARYIQVSPIDGRPGDAQIGLPIAAADTADALAVGQHGHAAIIFLAP